MLAVSADSALAERLQADLLAINGTDPYTTRFREVTRDRRAFQDLRLPAIIIRGIATPPAEVVSCRTLFVWLDVTLFLVIANLRSDHEADPQLRAMMADVTRAMLTDEPDPDGIPIHYHGGACLGTYPRGHKTYSDFGVGGEAKYHGAQMMFRLKYSHTWRQP